MSNRALDPGIIEILRSLTERIARLESQNSAVRKNDIRLGKMVVTTDPLYNRIAIKNVNTKQQVYLGNPPDAVFSFSGSVEAGSTSPPHVIPSQTVAKEIIVSCLSINQSSSDTDFVVHFDDGGTSVAMTLQGNSNTEIRGVNIPVGMNQNIYVTCTAVSGAAPVDVSVFVRFGSASTDFTTTDV